MGHEGIRWRLPGTWLRSWEEEQPDDDALVFRGPSFAFPPARAPRPALRLQPDGSLETALGVAPGDRRAAVPGRWRLRGRTLSLESAQLDGEFTVELVDDDRLVVRPAGERR